MCSAAAAAPGRAGPKGPVSRLASPRAYAPPRRVRAIEEGPEQLRVPQMVAEDVQEVGGHGVARPTTRPVPARPQMIDVERLPTRGLRRRAGRHTTRKQCDDRRRSEEELLSNSARAVRPMVESRNSVRVSCSAVRSASRAGSRPSHRRTRSWGNAAPASRPAEDRRDGLGDGECQHFKRHIRKLCHTSAGVSPSQPASSSHRILVPRRAVRP